VTVTCRVLGVSTSGYYEWRHRRPSARDVTDAHLINTLHDVHAQSRCTYGVRRCHAELRLGEWQLRVGHKRVWRLMRLAGLQRGAPASLAAPPTGRVGVAGPGPAPVHR